MFKDLRCIKWDKSILSFLVTVKYPTFRFFWNHYDLIVSKFILSFKEDNFVQMNITFKNGQLNDKMNIDWYFDTIRC